MRLIKTPTGLAWITIPVGQDISRKIREVQIHDSKWQEKHWKTLVSNYSRAQFFSDVASILEPHYCHRKFGTLSEVNRVLIEEVRNYLGIQTKVSSSWDYILSGGKVERLVSLCQQANASVYVSGPSARAYLKPEVFEQNGIQVEWFDYSGYPEYPQLWGKFEHAVTILDLLFNCGPASPNYMRNSA